MNEASLGEFLLILSLLFALSYIVGAMLERFKIPAILGALFVGIALTESSVAKVLLQGSYKEIFDFLANLGVLFLLFFIGSEIDLKQMKKQSGEIVEATVLNTIFPFILGFLTMLAFGYGFTISFVIGIACMPTAEAVVVPILDEFKMIKSKIGSYIIGAGVLDDIIEVFLVTLVSLLIGAKEGIIGSSTTAGIGRIAADLGLFILCAWLILRYILPFLVKISYKNRLLLLIATLFAFGGFASASSLGLVVGAIAAGAVFSYAAKDKKLLESVKSFSYGFFGIIFFLWIGLSVNINGITSAPLLTLAIFAAAFFGKVLGILTMVPLKKLNFKEALLVGIGLNARLTTEIIVAKLLLDANLIDAKLFSALVAVSSISTVTVSVLFTLFLKQYSKAESKKLKA